MTGVDPAEIGQLPDIYWLAPAKPSAGNVTEVLAAARAFAQSPKEKYIGVPFTVGFRAPAIFRYEQMLEVFQAAANQGAKGGLQSL